MTRPRISRCTNYHAERASRCKCLLVCQECCCCCRCWLCLPVAWRPTRCRLWKAFNRRELDKAITALDVALFDSYIRCDLEKFASFFADDVEFYHDQGGVTLGREKLTDSVKKNICGKVTRELVPGTLQVYYMKGYGAVEMGVHRFHPPGHEDTEAVGEGKFIHLWQY